MMNDGNTAKADILVVDDTHDNLRLLNRILTAHGYHVRPVLDGAKALSVAQNTPPDLILLDIVMPKLDGYAVCEQLKADDRTRHVPVIFISALGDTFDKVKAFSLGGVDYITKPFQEEELLARVNTHLLLRNVQTQLREKNRELEELNAYKDKFFSIIAHDLKNPLTGFLSFASILEHFEDLRKDEITELTMQFRASAENLFALLENLLTWSRIQRDMFEYRPCRIDLWVIIAKNIELFTPNARQKQITLRQSVQEQTTASGDYEMIDFIVRNLLSNAVKFTRTDGIIDVSATPHENDVTVAIADTGIGISEKMLARLFRIDATCQRAGTADDKGTGLGLILCKEFLEKHDSAIQVESEVGKGTTMRFTLPKSPVE
jgi:signal transduction histidine kinase